MLDKLQMKRARDQYPIVRMPLFCIEHVLFKRCALLG
jgi:hypothetical protein